MMCRPSQEHHRAFHTLHSPPNMQNPKRKLSIILKPELPIRTFHSGPGHNLVCTYALRHDVLRRVLL